jgi:aldehyde dehydrogenase (NAD+)
MIFIKKIKDRMQSLMIGNPLDKNTDIGAVNSKSTVSNY